MLAITGELLAGPPLGGGPASRRQILGAMLLLLVWSLFNRGTEGRWTYRHKYLLFVVFVMWPICVLGLVTAEG